MRDIGAEVITACAAEPDRAGPATGLDVGGFGAGPIRDSDLAEGVSGVLGGQQCGGLTPDPVAMPVELQGGDLVDGVAAAFLFD